MVEVVRCRRPATGQCIEEGCTRKAVKRDRCDNCYNRWYRSDDFEPAPLPPPYVPPPDPVCPWCGLYKPNPGASAAICPTCGLDAAEIAYSERIIADSDAVWREENRAFQAKRRENR